MNDVSDPLKLVPFLAPSQNVFLFFLVMNVFLGWAVPEHSV